MAERKYIEMETVKRHIRRLIQDPWNHQAAPASWADAYRQMIDILDDEPAADVRPVKRGEWVGEYDGYADGMPVYDMWSCSVCGKRFDEWDERPSWSFCPNCGADMRPKEDNDG